MRIGLIVNGRLHSVSSGHLYDAQLVSCLYEEGDDVEVISLSDAGFTQSLKQNLNRAFFDNLRRANFDLLLQDARTYPALFWLNQRLQPETPFPIVSIVHAVQHEAEWLPWLKFGYRKLEQRYFETADAFICSSRMARVSVEKLLNDTQERPSMVAYPGSDRLPSSISPHDIVSRAQKPGPLHVVFVGGYEQRQALFSLVTALNYLPSHQWHLDVISDFVVESRTRRRWLPPMLDMIDTQQNVTFCGTPTKEAIVEIYQRNQVAVIPDGDGVLGASIIEAMSFGLPVIGTTRGATREIIQHGRNGYRLTANNSIPMARHLALLISNRRLLLRLGLEAHKRYQTHPTWNESMNAIRDFLVEVVNRNHSLAPADQQ
ncbi:MAG: hypothetical protein CSB13_01280 [Chloroflexi bacterium]|nr:MAG: hypothetical protein CSB13_01280 [Chloroflexota bacterium]